MCFISVIHYTCCVEARVNNHDLFDLQWIPKG